VDEKAECSQLNLVE